MTLNYKGFTVNVRGKLDAKSYAAGDARYMGNCTAKDWTLSYSRKFGIFQAGAGTFIMRWPDSQLCFLKKKKADVYWKKLPSMVKITKRDI